MILQGIIFDCDGTLVDSEHLAAQLLHELLAEQAVALPLEQVLQRFRGVQFQQFLDGLSAEFPHLATDELASRFRAGSLPLFREKLAEMPGASVFVRGLELHKCIASNAPRQKIETCLHAVGLLEAFSGRIVSAYEVQAWKPSPKIIEEAAEVMGVPVGHCLLVDDSVPGVQAGLAAGAQVAGYGEADFGEVQDHPNFHRTRDYPALERLVQHLAG
ncbi:MAG: 6-phosphogluconate phosphatase [Stenotrophomonas maltophilia]|nr:MAG: 6-phosphogluconate phosphatase [Stenotrophomonas maltophilia]